MRVTRNIIAACVFTGYSLLAVAVRASSAQSFSAVFARPGRGVHQPVWLAPLGCVAGAAVALVAESVPRDRQQGPTGSQLALFALIVLLMAAGGNTYMAMAGAAFAAIGLRGILLGELTMSGRTGAGERTYEGLSARMLGASFVLWGAGFVAFAILGPW